MMVWVVIGQDGHTRPGYGRYSAEERESAERLVVRQHYPLVVRHTPLITKNARKLLAGYGLSVVPINDDYEHEIHKREK